MYVIGNTIYNLCMNAEPVKNTHMDNYDPPEREHDKSCHAWRQEVPEERYKYVTLLPLSFGDVGTEDIPACSTHPSWEEWAEEPIYCYDLTESAIVLTGVLKDKTAERLGLVLQGFDSTFAVYTLRRPLNLASLVEEIQEEEVEIQDMYWPCAI